MKLISTGIVLMLLSGGLYATHVTPEETVRDTTDEVLARLDKDKVELAAHPEYLQVLVQELIVPHFDFDTMARLVLRRYWKDISDPDQIRFISGFRDLLVKRYAYILLSYRNHSITYEPVQPMGKRGYVIVKQIITSEGRPPLPIEYPMRPLEDGWKVIDLVVDGISLVTNYRKTFQDEINKKGMEDFIRSF
jgi:phospholipid transport system substrate-binding protein